MSLSPFDSFQSRFVTYLLNFPRICTIFKAVYSVVYHFQCLDCEWTQQLGFLNFEANHLEILHVNVIGLMPLLKLV